MRNRLIKILEEMSFKAFNIEEQADFLLSKNVLPIVRCEECFHSTKSYMHEDFYLCDLTYDYHTAYEYCKCCLPR